jgi:hypothetical protein
MPRYVAYGLNIDSDVCLPELLPADGDADVAVRLGSRRALPVSHEEGLVRATDEEATISFNDVGSFSIREGREIVIDPVPGVSDRLLRLVLLGPCIGAVLYQRGWLPLHASAVTAVGGAIAFMAERGFGKSTTAAAMHAHGYSLIADDITATRFDDTRLPIVVPGYPQFKLWPDAAAYLGDAPETLPRLNPDLEKRGRRVNAAFAAAPLPLKRIYVLDRGESLELEAYSPQKAFSELLRHTYGRELFQAVRTSSHFLQCTQIVKSVPMRGLKRPYSLAGLPEVVRTIEEDLRQDF